MKTHAVALVALCAVLWAKPGVADLTPAQAEQAAAFVAGVRALDPHTEESEPAFQALVEKHVPDAGQIQVYLEFMTASGFECPPLTSLAYKNGQLVFRCRFKPDLGPTGEPNLSGVVEVSWFSVTAYCTEKRYIMRVEGSMTHGFIGP